jgi:1,4-alpha-glucan branching enzyme
LYPGIPLIFMGEEFAADSPFPFFTDFQDAGLRRAVERGRAREYPQHVWGKVLSPVEADTFYRSRCGAASGGDDEMLAWYRDMIALRKRGIAEGWLTVTRMTADHDRVRSIFSLRYTRADGSAVLVQARLTAAGDTTAETVRAPLEGPVLLSSEPNPSTDHGHVILQRNHAVICKS